MTTKAALAGTLGLAILSSTPAEGARALRFGVSGGGLVLDSDLADFGWDATGRPVWALTAALSGERYRAGLRLSRAATTQSLGLPGQTAHPDVRLTGAVAIAELDAFRFAGLDVGALASLGTLHVGYSPDRLTVEPIDGGEALSIELDPITEPTAGIGLAIGRTLGRSFEVDLRGERSWFRLDTSHRKGEEIVNERRTFGLWTIALSLSRSHAFGGTR